MFYLVYYFHPVTNNKYYFRKFNSQGKPIGFHRINRDRSVKFKSFSRAWDVASILSKLGYKVRVKYCKSSALADVNKI